MYGDTKLDDITLQGLLSNQIFNLFIYFLFDIIFI